MTLSSAHPAPPFVPSANRLIPRLASSEQTEAQSVFEENQPWSEGCACRRSPQTRHTFDKPRRSRFAGNFRFPHASRRIPAQADPETLLGLVRGYRGIEIKQHYRRDHTQREDHCHVRETLSARNLSLMRSMAIFLYERQRWRRGGERSLPDWQSKNHRNPNPLIGQLIASTE